MMPQIFAQRCNCYKLVVYNTDIGISFDIRIRSHLIQTVQISSQSLNNKL
jgi:hypothetical protein